jgi:hypothetical protein
MLAYSIPEAESLLESKLIAAQQSLDNCEEDLDFLREQITVSKNSRFGAGGASMPRNCWVMKSYLFCLLTRSHRLSKSRPPEYTTGTLRSVVKTRKAEKGQ